MSVIALTAPLIRLAAVDDAYARDLFEAVDTDASAKETLVYGPIQARDLAQLTPTEWQWYANWRQALGGRLDENLLSYLTDSVTTRFARFEVRALVLRDPLTNELALKPDTPLDQPNAIGLRWLSGRARAPRIVPVADIALSRHFGESEPPPEQALDDPVAAAYWERRQRAETDEALELTTDALQCATDASWFLLRQLIARNDEAGMLVQQRLGDFAEERGLNPRWYQLGQPLRYE